MSFRKLLVLTMLAGGGLSLVFAQNDLPSLLSAGEGFERREEWVKATEMYKRAAAEYPTQSAGFEHLGDVYRKNGAFALAADNYRKALALNPDDARIRDLLRACEQAVKDGSVIRQETFRSLGAAAKTRGLVHKTAAAATTEPERIPFHIDFPRNKYSIGDLDADARRQLDEVAALLVSPDWRDRRPVIVEGHACSCGTPAANLSLGKKRGEAVLEYLIAKKALSPGDGSVVSMGSSNPIVAPEHEQLSAEACARDDAHNQNRRVVIKEARGAASPLVTFWYKPSGTADLRPLTDGSVLWRNDEMKVKIQSAAPVFAYVVHRGPDNGWEVLYPRQGAKEAALLPADAHSDGYWIPGEDHGFSVRGKAGQEEAYVYLSPTPIAEFEARQKKDVVKPVDVETRPVTTGKVNPPPEPTRAKDGSIQVGEEVTVRSLVVSAALKIDGPPRTAQPAAKVKFESRD